MHSGLKTQIPVKRGSCFVLAVRSDHLKYGDGKNEKIADSSEQNVYK